MDDVKHTAEPWSIEEFAAADTESGIAEICIMAFADENGKEGATIATLNGWNHGSNAPPHSEAESNADRICAAVNACQGITTEALQFDVVRKLVEALEEGVKLCGCDNGTLWIPIEPEGNSTRGGNYTARYDELRQHPCQRCSRLRAALRLAKGGSNGC